MTHNLIQSLCISFLTHTHSLPSQDSKTRGLVPWSTLATKGMYFQYLWKCVVVHAGESKCVNTDTHQCRDLVWQVYMSLLARYCEGGYSCWLWLKCKQKLSSEKGRVCESEGWSTNTVLHTDCKTLILDTAYMPGQLQKHILVYLQQILSGLIFWRKRAMLRKLKKNFRRSFTELWIYQLKTRIHLFPVVPMSGVIVTPSWLLFTSTAALLLPFTLLLASQQEKCTVLSNPCLYWP